MRRCAEAAANRLPDLFGGAGRCAMVVTAVAAAFFLHQWLAERSARRASRAELEKAEADLGAFSEELEGRIAERTDDLQQTIESLQSILYHIAHDLRAPVRAISGFASHLNEPASGSLTDEGREAAERIVLAAVRLDKLIHDLLDFGHLGHEPCHCQPTDCNRVISEVLTNLRDEIHSYHAQVRIAPNLPFVYANPRLLQTVFQQIISNALKFTKPGESPELQISAESGPSAVIIYLRDQGIGVDPRYHQKVFGLFAKLTPEASDQGTGMGLAIARKAVDRMGGQIGVESFPGKGSRFWVRLPRPA